MATGLTDTGVSGQLLLAWNEAIFAASF